MSESREASTSAPQAATSASTSRPMDVDPPASVSAHAGTSAEGATSDQGTTQQSGDDGEQPAEEDAADGDDGGEEYEIEQILGHEPDIYVFGEMAYFVSWVGYGPEENSWVREADAENAEEMLAEYWRKQKTTPKIRQISKTAERVWKEQQEAHGRDHVGAGGKRDRESAGGSHPSSNKKQRQGRARARLAGSVSDSDEDVDLSTLTASEREAIQRKRARRKYERLADWENVVKQITNIERHPDGKLIAFVKFDDGQLLAFDTSVIHHRCPQKLIAFYETRLRFRPAIRGAADTNAASDTVVANGGNSADDPDSNANGEKNGHAAEGPSNGSAIQDSGVTGTSDASVAAASSTSDQVETAQQPDLRQEVTA